MIDFHNHIIPGVDDGANDLLETKEMLLHAISQGITDVIATPHLQNPRFDDKQITDNDILTSYHELVDYIDSQKIAIKIHLSAEVFFLPNLIKLTNHPFATLGNGRYLLIEFHHAIIPLSFKTEVIKLLDAGVIPIIAHPERYIQIQDDFNNAIRLHKLGSIFQIDTGSILGHYGTKVQKTAIKFLSAGLVNFVGSDAHNSRNRNFCLEPAMKKCEQYFGHDAEILVNDNPLRLLAGKDIISLKKKKSWFSIK
ncbi:MAG: hypothetical protein ISR90_01570 [Candidatus Marinimicrobia bacterium]|nr:hypothetical protein [Candidatus Neomarinimicrobiota bacterium]MBL7022733.1 hypothetical protein [Candidatus Neomarinimicrobiota bacterium]MBL7109138.1 hypothetical protein [Candidatus Neomarinimicrobiota bacterium]